MIVICQRARWPNDKVRMCEEIMMNDDNLESNLLASSLLKRRLVYMLAQVELRNCVQAICHFKLIMQWEDYSLLQWRIQDFPLGEGGTKLLGGTDLRCGCFLAKTYAKTKELDPVGGGGCTPAAPPGSTNVLF